MAIVLKAIDRVPVEQSRCQRRNFYAVRGLVPWDIGEFAHSINFHLGGEQAVVLKWDKLPACHFC